VDSLQPRVHPKGPPPWLNRKAEFLHGDVRDPAVMRRALDGVEVVFHEAAYQDYMPDFSTFLSTNATSTALILEILAETGQDVRKVVVASSQAAYGEGAYRCAEHGPFQAGPRPAAQLARGDWEMRCPVCAAPCGNEPLTEDQANPQNAYALSKLFEEMTALRLGRLHGIPAAALRYSITQGPRQSLYNSYSGVCRIFSLRLLHGQPPVIYEDGLQKRDYVHVDDVVDANLLVLDDDRATWEAFNVGGDRAVTVRDFAAELARVLKRDIAPAIPGEYRVGDNRHSVSSVEKLKALGWRPKRSLRQILEDYVAWVEQFGDVGAYFEEADRLMRETGAVRAASDKGAGP
jgi:dTDP-L-rhamnose 4-epimerase